MTGWLVNWIMSTRPHAQGTVTANTGTQLETKTWAQIAKWTKMSVTAHWFSVSMGRGSMKMVHKEHPASWFCTAQTCREENSEAFAGQHAANSTSFYINDEASAIPEKIWEVQEGREKALEEVEESKSLLLVIHLLFLLVSQKFLSLW